jgi:hypothetical protein
MYVVEVIEPKNLKNKESVSCFMCLLKYPKDEYKILRENKKLIYFKWNTKEEDFTVLSSLTLCHGCLFKMIKKIHPNKETKVKVLTEEFEYDLSFDPDARLNEDEDEEESYGDDISGFFG